MGDTCNKRKLMIRKGAILRTHEKLETSLRKMCIRDKRTEDDDVRFAQSFEKLILIAKSKEGAQSGTI